MKRPRRWLFHAVAASSLLLSVATITFWSRSYRQSDDFWWWGARHGIGIFSVEGRILFWHGTRRGQPSVMHSVLRPPIRWPREPTSGLYSQKYQIGFGSVTKDGPRWNELFLPHAVVLLLTLIFPIRWAIIYRRTIQPTPGCCRHCGYDLRATPDRCPECGTIPTKLV